MAEDNGDSEEEFASAESETEDKVLDEGNNETSTDPSGTKTDTEQTHTDTTHSDTEPEKSDTEPREVDTGASQSDTGTSQSGTSSWSWGWGSITSTLSNAVTKATELTTELTSSVINKGGEEREKEGLEEEGQEVPTSQEMTRDSVTDDDKEDQTIGGLFTGIATAVQSTGASILSGGLDALEVIGRKTVDIISEGDPGLRKKRALLTGDTKTLSQLLKEAKETNNDNNDDNDGQGNASLLINYSLLIEQYGGLVHLEALEILSEDCTNKLQSIDNESVNDGIQSLCQYFNMDEHEDDEDDARDFNNISLLIIDRVKADQLIQCRDDIKCQSVEETDKNIEVLYEDAMNGMARICSNSLQLLKKTSEILLLPGDEYNDLKDVAIKLNKITVIISNEFETVASLYAEKINEKSSEDKAQQFITSLYLEASSSSSYIQSAHRLLLPILQYRLSINN